MRTNFLLILFILLAISASAQVSQARFEIPLRPHQNEPYVTVSLENDGLLLYSLFIGKDKNAVELIRLDTAFKEVWKGYIPIDRNLYIAASRFYDNTIFLLMKDRFNPLAQFTVIAVSTENGNYITRFVKTMLAFIPAQFVVTKHAMIIGGYFTNRPLALYYNFNTNKSKILPGFANEPGELNHIRADEAGNIDIVVSARGGNRRRSLWIRNYDQNGDLTKNVLLQGDDDKNLIFGRSITGPGGEQIVCGVYGRYTEYSRGVFVANVNNQGEYAIKYYNYGDLDRFFNYMKARREKRVKERIERRKIRGKKIRFNYRLMVDDILPYGDQFVMLGEAFYPHYSYPSQSMRGYGQPAFFMGPRIGYSRGDLIFDGYQYTHAVVIGFDRNGNLTWDNSFEINDVRTFQLEQFVKIHPDAEKISLVYLFDNVIRSKIIKDADVLEGKSYDELHTGAKDDVVRERDTQQAKLDYWYGDNFYASGIQQIRKRFRNEEHISRRVFFVNKIEYK